jgi:hypothetical protein
LQPVASAPANEVVAVITIFIGSPRPRHRPCGPFSLVSANDNEQLIALYYVFNERN